MTDNESELICPFMSRPILANGYPSLCEAMCREHRCRAWVAARDCIDYDDTGMAYTEVEPAHCILME